MTYYLNRHEKDAVIVLALAEAHIDTLLKNAEKTEAKYLRTARTYIEKARHENFKRVGRSEGEKVLKMIKTHRIEINPMSKQQYACLKIEEFYDLAEGILTAHCSNCNKEGKKVERCGIKKIFENYNVPYFGEEGENCPYKVSK